MENETLCDTLKTPSDGEEESKEETAQDTLPNSTSSPDSTRAESPRDESDASSDWRSSQAVEESTVLPPSMKDSATEESIVRRRKGKDENSTSEIQNSNLEPKIRTSEPQNSSSELQNSTAEPKNTSSEPKSSTSKPNNSTFESPDNADHEPYTILDPEDDSAEEVKCREKKKRIQKVLSSDPLDLEALKDLAISCGGLMDDTLRREAWPLLMGLGRGEPEAKKPEMEVVEGHKDFQQVVLDVKRTLKRFPPGIEDSRRVILMDQLIVLIIRVLMRHPHLYYYQGYHDVAITFLLVTGEDMGFRLVERLSITHLKEFMGPTMEKTNYYLTYLYPILERANRTLYDCLVKSGVDTMFCLPWLITWFAHTLSDYRHVVRLYDFFLASHELMPMYIATAIVLQKEKELLAEEEQEVCAIFSILSKDPDNLPFEDILVKARELYEKYPPGPLKDDVDNFIVKRKERERKESERIAEMRRRADKRNKRPQRLVDRIFAYVPVHLVLPAQRRKLFKLALFTASILIARSLYKNYYTSAIEYSAVLE